MGQPKSRNVINRDQYDAVLLDLDGVITDTASLHAACWKQMFDEYLQKRATQRGEAFRPFDLATDYRLYVDGKPRFDGVRDFLASRGIQLPEGGPHDPPQVETVGGLGNRKNDLVNKLIEYVGVKPYAGSVQFISLSPPRRIQNRRRHLESELRGRLEGRQVGRLLRRTSRWQHDPGATPGGETRPGHVLDSSEAIGR